jgi:hypothetical protein
VTPARVVGVVLAAGALLAMSWCADHSWRADDGTNAIVRVSIGARPERIEVCRRQSDEELAKVAPQMRQRVVCEGASARYRLELFRDGQRLLQEVVRGGGLRHDRPLYVFREFEVAPGAASYALRLTRIDTVRADHDDEEEDDEEDEDRARRRASDSALIGERARRESEQRQRQRASVLPVELALRLDATLEAGEVMLLTYEASERALKALRNTPD